MASSWSRASSPSWGATLGPSSSPQSRCSPVLAQEQSQVLLGGEQGQEGPHGTGGVGTAPPAHSAESEGFDKHLCHPSTGDKSLQGPGLGLGLLLFVFVLIPRSPVHPPKPGSVCCHCYCSPCYQGRMMGTGTGTGGAARAAEGGWDSRSLNLAQPQPGTAGQDALGSLSFPPGAALTWLGGQQLLPSSPTCPWSCSSCARAGMLGQAQPRHLLPKQAGVPWKNVRKCSA